MYKLFNAEISKTRLWRTVIRKVRLIIDIFRILKCNMAAVYITTNILKLLLKQYKFHNKHRHNSKIHNPKKNISKATKVELKLYYVPINIQYFKSISQKTPEKSPDNF